MINDGNTPKDSRGPLPPEMFAAILEGGPAGRGEAWLVFLGHRQPPPEQKRLAAFAEAFGIDPYTARQWLNSPAPRLLRRVPSRERAARWVEFLAGLGLAGFSVEEAVLASRQPVSVSSWSREEDAFAFEPVKGPPVSLPSGQLLCIAAGEVREEFFEERTEKLGLMGELARGHDRTRVSSRYLFDLHFRGSGGVYRFDQDLLAFARMFPGRGGQASSVLVRGLLASIREAAPAVPVYTEFHFAEESLGRAREALEKSSDLMRRWMFGGGARHSETQTHFRATLPAFHLYSSLLAEELRQVAV